MPHSFKPKSHIELIGKNGGFPDQQDVGLQKEDRMKDE